MFFVRGDSVGGVAEATDSASQVFFFDISRFCPISLRGKLEDPPDEKERGVLIQAYCELDCRYVGEALARLVRPAPCLCCFHTPNESRAADLSRQLGEIQCYLTFSAYGQTSTHRRVAESAGNALVQPGDLGLSAGAWAGVPAPIQRALRACRRIGHDFGWCYRTNEVWFANRKGVGRLLRQISRLAKKSGGVLRVRTPSIRRLVSLPRPGDIRMIEYHSAPGKSRSELWELIVQAARPN
jgi:hypothetical protein